MPRESFKCYYNAKTKLYRKRIKDITGKYVPLYDRDKNILKIKYDAAKEAIKSQLQVKGNITVAEYAKRWFDLNTGELSQARKSDYKIAINNHIAPAIGNMLIKDVQLDDLKEILSNMNELSYSTQIKTVTTLKQIFESAKANKLILQSPCLTLKAGGYESEEKNPLSDEQAKTLLEAVKGTSVYPFIMIGLYTGLRREEILGLRWDCVHLEDVPYISVRQALTFNGCRPIISDKLKTKSARRDIPIPPELVECLKSMERKSELVVCNTLSEPHSFTSFRNMWKIVERRMLTDEDKKQKAKEEKAKAEGYKIIESKAGKSKKHPAFKRTIDFDVSPHILRHTFICNLVMSGMNIKKVQYLAGHRDLRMTLGVYTKLMENKPEDMIEDVRKAFS